MTTTTTRNASLTESVHDSYPVLRLRGGPADDVAEKLRQRKEGKEKLAGAFRIFHKLGFDETIAGHISMRDPVNPDWFWMNPYGLAFDHVCVSDLLCLDHEGNVMEGSGRPGDGQIYNAAGFVIHGSMHAARPDFNSIAHSHSIYGKAFSMMGRNIDIGDFDAAALSQKIKLYDNFDGPVLDEQEGQHLADALGPEGRGLIMQNHGILTAGQSVEAVVAYYVALEELCRAQLAADALGVRGKIADPEVAEIFGLYGGEEAAIRAASTIYDDLDAETGGDYRL